MLPRLFNKTRTKNDNSNLTSFQVPNWGYLEMKTYNKGNNELGCFHLPPRQQTDCLKLCVGCSWKCSKMMTSFSDNNLRRYRQELTANADIVHIQSKGSKEENLARISPFGSKRTTIQSIQTLTITD